VGAHHTSGTSKRHLQRFGIARRASKQTFEIWGKPIFRFHRRDRTHLHRPAREVSMNRRIAHASTLHTHANACVQRTSAFRTPYRIFRDRSIATIHVSSLFSCRRRSIRASSFAGIARPLLRVFSIPTRVRRADRDPRETPAPIGRGRCDGLLGETLRTTASQIRFAAPVFSAPVFATDYAANSTGTAGKSICVPARWFT
jgi:hypothetical protein